MILNSTQFKLKLKLELSLAMTLKNGRKKRDTMNLRHLQENHATIFTKVSNNTEPGNLSETMGGTGEADIIEKEKKKHIENTIMFSVSPHSILT